jgi:hypothetical protein
VAAALPLHRMAGSDRPALAPVLDGVRGGLSQLLVAVNETVTAARGAG